MRKRRGFLSGLMENMVAAAVILIGLSFLVTGIPLSNRAAHQAELRCQASDIAVRYLTTARQGDASAYPAGFSEPIKEGDFTGDLKVTAVTGYSGLRDITVNLNWEYAGMPGHLERKMRINSATY